MNNWSQHLFEWLQYSEKHLTTNPQVQCLLGTGASCGSFRTEDTQVSGVLQWWICLRSVIDTWLTLDLLSLPLPFHQTQVAILRSTVSDSKLSKTGSAYANAMLEGTFYVWKQPPFLCTSCPKRKRDKRKYIWKIEVRRGEGLND